MKPRPRATTTGSNMKPPQPETEAASENNASAPMRYEARLDELEKVVASLESGELELEDSIQAYRRGVALLRECEQQLDVAQRKTEVLEDGVLQETSQEKLRGA